MDTALALHPLTDEFLPAVLGWWEECADIRRWLHSWTPRESFRPIGHPIYFAGTYVPCLFSQEWVMLDADTATPVAYMHAEILPLKDSRDVTDAVVRVGPNWRPHMHIQIAVGSRHRGQQYGPRAIEALIRHMPNLGQHYWLHIDQDNEASRKMAMRAGFELTGTTGQNAPLLEEPTPTPVVTTSTVGPDSTALLHAIAATGIARGRHTAPAVQQ